MIVPPAYRRHPWIAAVVGLLLVTALVDHLLVSHQRDDYRRYHGRVFRVTCVIDGATIEIDCPDQRAPITRVRLCGLAPPLPNPDEDPPDLPVAEAATVAADILLGQDVRLELAPTQSRDDQCRLLAYVHLASSGQRINEVLLEAGLVRTDPARAHPFSRRFRDLEARAQRQAVRRIAEERADAVSR